MDCCFKEGDIYIPQNVDFTKWAVIACDQFTSEPSYWEKLEKFVGEEKSALNLILPEIYLSDNPEKRIEKTNGNIEKYLKEGVFSVYKNCFVLTVRKTKFVQKRVGLLGLLDLEEYDFNPLSKSLVRATEGTILERIPPRLKIRKNAVMEFPHVMVLIDDEKREIIESVYNGRENLDKLYSFNLNMDGGSIEGYLVKDTEIVKDKLNSLLIEERLIKKYGKVDKLLFAVGDGNHSLATAKTHWENVKKTLSDKEKENHPARYALVEINNVYDEGIYFEPIHRFVYGVAREKFVEELKKIDGGNIKVFTGKELRFSGIVSLPEGIKAVDGFIKKYIAENGGGVDYVHGDENIKRLVEKREDSVGILFSKLEKNSLFKYVVDNGALPRKTFSMGEGIEKRYYLEGRKIK